VLVDTEKLVTAAEVQPDGVTRWVVAFVGEHDTLRPGDVVLVTETPSHDNVFIRPADLTIHALQGEWGYVVLAPVG
jgi:hypothetical protein